MLLEESTPPETSTKQAVPSAPDHVARLGDHTILIAVLAGFGVFAALSYLIQLALPAPLALGVATILGLILAGAASERMTGAWAGAVAWPTLCITATVVIFEIARTARHRVALSLTMTAIAGALVAGAWLVRTLKRGNSFSDATTQLTRIFTEPSTALAPALLGAGLALPLIGSYGPNVADPDSAWIVAATQETRDNGIELIQQTQDALLPHLTTSPLLAIGGFQAAVPFMILTMMGLVALTAYLGQRISGHAAGAIAAAAALLAMPAMVARTDRLPMYAAAFAFAYGSGWLLHRAMSDPRRHRWLPLAAGVGFVLAYEAHNVGQIFLMLPFLLLLLHPLRRALRPLALTLATIAVVSIPRIAINLSVDGLKDFRSNYTSWAISQGYLRQINQNFYGLNVEKSPVRYLGNIPGMVETAVGGRGVLLLIAIPAVLAALRSGRRSMAFVVASAGMFFLALVVAAPATYDRYVTPLAAGFALAAGVGVAIALRDSRTSRTLGMLMVSALVVAAFYQMSDTVASKAEQHAMVSHGPLPTLASYIDDDRRVLGIRSHQLARVDPTIPTLFGRKMAEEDFVTFVTWPSDEEVAELMDRLDVGWVYVLPDPRFEVRYHQTWLEPVYGETVNHPLELAASEDFCLVTDINGYRLYRYGDCQPGDEGANEDLGIDDPRLNGFRVEAGLAPIPEPTSEPDATPAPADQLETDWPAEVSEPIEGEID
jgi:hypothetical protein